MKKMGRFYVVTTDFGLKIMSKRFYVLTYIPESYKGNVSACCFLVEPRSFTCSYVRRFAYTCYEDEAVCKYR